MQFVWQDYAPETMGYVESWLDDAAVAATGLDEGFRAFYEYWMQEDGFVMGENFWCKVVFSQGIPLAVLALGLDQGSITVMEMVVAPEKRGRGIGTRLLEQLLAREDILGFAVQKSEAVIYPDNIASQKAFEHAGFRHVRTHQDENGSSLQYVYDRHAPASR